MYTLVKVGLSNVFGRTSGGCFVMRGQGVFEVTGSKGGLAF